MSLLNTVCNQCFKSSLVDTTQADLEVKVVLGF